MNQSTRTMCDILEDMRACIKTLNFSYLSGLIEEAQYRANRMESAIELCSDNWGGLDALYKTREEIRDEIKQLKLDRSKLKRDS